MTAFFNEIVLFDTDMWIVLTRAPRAFGPFSSRKKAKLFAACHGGIALTWHEPEGMCEGWDHEGAVWFNNDWNAPFVIGGPFFDCEDARSVCAHWFGAESGIAIELEWPDDDYWDDGDGGEAVSADDILVLIIIKERQRAA